MLSQRETAIKDALIDEMGGLTSYAEHRKVGSDIDGQFVAEARGRIKRAQLGLGVLMALALLPFLLHVLQLWQSGSPITMMINIAVGLNFGALTAAHMARQSKRRVAFRVFSILAEGSSGDGSDADPGKVDG
jgi:hypothetical protein